MKAVNLLPEKHRPRQPSGGQGKGGYVVLGLLGAVLVGLLVYVLTLNSINDSRTKVTEATAEAARLNDQANSLGPYGDFAKIKAERVKSVMTLAEGRFDYERLVRELAHVLPPDVWLVNASASSVADSTTGAPNSTPAPGAAPAPATGPTLKLQGCARAQRRGAAPRVRPRERRGPTVVPPAPPTRGGAGPPTAPAAAAGSSAGGDAGCGTTAGKPNYSFE